MLISDFGLCKRLDVDQTSFLPTAYGALAAGTVGWRAPEILRGEVKLDEGLAGEDRGSMSSRGSVGTVTGNSSSGGVGSSANKVAYEVDEKRGYLFAWVFVLLYTHEWGTSVW
jgi:serine/threonine-protein kinase/endoribonuclease IRE1